MDGRRIRPAALIRSDSVDHLTPTGWQQLSEHGVKTIIDLRNEDEVGNGSCPGFRVVHLPHDSWESQDFWSEWASGPQFGTPLYYGPHLTRFPERTARVLQAVAEAESGGVLVHCQVGRDRTGMVIAILLHLLGLPWSTIADDYLLSQQRLPAYYADRNESDPTLGAQAYLDQVGLSFEQSLGQFLAVDVRASLRRGGLCESTEERLKRRLLEPADTAGRLRAS